MKIGGFFYKKKSLNRKALSDTARFRLKNNLLNQPDGEILKADFSVSARLTELLNQFNCLFDVIQVIHAEVWRLKGEHLVNQ